MRAIHIVFTADFVQSNNFAYQKGIFYLNQFALVIEFLQAFSIKYSFLLFKVLVNTIFAEYPKKYALTNQPSSGRKGDRGSGERSPRNFILLRISPRDKLMIFILLFAKYILTRQPPVFSFEQKKLCFTQKS